MSADDYISTLDAQDPLLLPASVNDCDNNMKYCSYTILFYKVGYQKMDKVRGNSMAAEAR